MEALSVNGNVKTFGKQSFYNCKKLKKVVFKGNRVPTFEAKVFKGTTSNILVKLNQRMSKSSRSKFKSRLYTTGVSQKARHRLGDYQ